MKRFFCTECKSVKRVRVLPASIDDSQSTFVVDRIGKCDYHAFGRVKPIRIKPTYTKFTPVVTNTPKKSKRGGR